jgi:sugar phosphate isomerase/epimerase
MGFDAIEFTDLQGDSLDEQKAYAKAICAEAKNCEIEINAYTIGACLFQETESQMEAEVERLKGQLEVAKLLGAGVMRHDVCYKLGKTGKSRSFDLMLPTIAKNARIELEQKTGKSVVTSLNARDGIGLETDTKSSVFLENEEEK